VTVVANSRCIRSSGGGAVGSAMDDIGVLSDRWGWRGGVAEEAEAKRAQKAR
jgi:hypothetical protein